MPNSVSNVNTNALNPHRDDSNANTTFPGARGDISNIHTTISDVVDTHTTSSNNVNHNTLENRKDADDRNRAVSAHTLPVIG